MKKECVHCGIMFPKSQTVSSKLWEKTKFCSRKCADIHKRKPLSEFTRECLYCHEAFLVKKPSVKSKYCSMKCWGLDQIGKNRVDISGEKHWNWRGGKTKEQELVRKSIEYKTWRKSVFERDGYRCVLCGDKRGHNLEADHIKPFASNPELRFVTDNGRTLCHDCHTKTDTYLNGSIRDTITGRFRSNFI